MKIVKVLIVVIGGLLIIATSSHSSQTEKKSGNVLKRQAKGANLDNVMVGQAVVNALSKVSAPGGVATISDCTGQVSHVFPLGDSSLRGVLDSIVSIDPRYTWEIKDEVINVLPSNGLPPFFAVRISRFEISQVETPNEALSKLLSMPEVRKARLNLGRRAVQGGVYVFCPECPPTEKKKISVNLKDITVREALNAIARAHGAAVWRFSQSKCSGSESFSLEFSAE
jgi:hypothetical protein